MTQIERHDFDLIKYIPFFIAGMISFILCSVTEWYSDATYYQYFIPMSDDGYPDKRIESFKDIFFSQYHHYLNTNGRFFVHFLVQLFCGILGKYLFAFFNAVIWFLLPLLCLKISKGNTFSLKDSVMATGFIVFLLIPLRFDPPFQINYSWMAVMLCGWILFFFKDADKRGAGWYTFIALYSFLLGEGNESFSIPVGGAIIVYAFMKKFRLTPTQWFSSISFGIGAFVLILSPGNWVRYEEISSGEGLGLAILWNILPCLIYPMIYLLSRFFTKKREEPKIAYFNIFLLSSGILSYLLVLILEGGSGIRTLIAGNLCFILLVLPYLVDRKSTLIIGISTTLACFVALWIVTNNIIRMKSNDKAIYDGYAKTTDGIVYLSDAIFISRIYQFTDSYSTYQTEARYRYPGKPNLMIRPESMRSLPLDKDTNIVLKLSDKAWLLLQSKTSPKDFIVKKNMFPGLLNLRMKDRTLDFTKNYDITFDSTEYCRAAIYINTRPVVVSANVIMQ